MKKTLWKIALPAFIACMSFGLVSCGDPVKKSSDVSSSSLATSVQPSVTAYSVTFNYNYTGCPTATVVSVNENGKVAKPADPTRDGFNFLGWYTDKGGSAAYSFDAAVTASFTLYAKWLDSSIKTYTVTFDLNYSGAPAASTQIVEAGGNATKPAEPVRDGYVFLNWYADAACTAKFSFGKEINADTTIYADWAGSYVFEAEYCSCIEDMSGYGYSGTATGTNMILKDKEGTGLVSNSYYVTYLYGYGIDLQFEINSDTAVTDAKVVLRLSAESHDITITQSKYLVKVNSDILSYSDISFTDVPPMGSLKPFADYVISTNVSLAKGKNTVDLITNNSDSMGGTMNATAPMVDCLKIQTKAVLTWTPDTANIVGR
jgi:uncharacterized repeat protein (TIGR02543 family)